MLTVRLPSGLEDRLEAVAKRVGRSKDELVVEAIVEEVQDLEDGLIALDRLQSGEAEYFTLDEVRERLGLKD